MPRYHDRFDEPDDELRDDEYPDPDEYDDESTDTVACPHCGADVYEDAEYCPACDRYITTTGGTTFSGRPLWWILLGLAGVVATLIAMSMS